MNYSSVKALITAGINNADVIRAGVKNDNGYDSIALPEWFTFGSEQKTFVFIHGNSHIGFNHNTYNTISINKRNAASFYVYYEEGTLWHTISFIKIRWSGFTAYNTTNVTAKLTYDVIFFSTGEVYVEIIDMPTDYIDGEFMLYGAENYTFEIGEGKSSISFYPIDANAGTYNQARYEVVNIATPFDERYLIKKGDTLYTIENGEIIELDEQQLSSTLFLNRGFLEVPDMNFFVSLGAFSLLYWAGTGTKEMPYKGRLFSEVKALPNGQEVISNRIDMSHSSILGIKSASADCEGDLHVSISIDEKQTWLVWDGSEWVSTSDEMKGMSKDVFDSLPEEALTLLYNQSKYAYLKIVLSTAEQSVTNLTLNYRNEEQEVIADE